MTTSRWLPARVRGQPMQQLRLGIHLPTTSGPGEYPHVLVSYAFWAARTGRRVYYPLPWSRERGYVFGDSGGFSVRTLGVTIDPCDVLEWQLRNCSAGVILDVPTFDKQYRRVWDTAFTDTQTNVRRVLPRYKQARKEGTPFRLWGVLHGMPGDERERWWRAVARLYPFTDVGEGWATGTLPSRIPTPPTVAEALRFLASKRVRCAHVFMCTAPATVVTLLYCAQELGLEYVSYDSSSFERSGIHRCLMVPSSDGLGWMQITERNRHSITARQFSVLTRQVRGHIDTRAREYMLQRCSCPACDLFRVKVDERPDYWLHDLRIGYWFILHNFYVHRETFARLTAAVRDDPRATVRAVLGKNAVGMLQALQGRYSFATSTGFSGGLVP